MVTHEIHKNMHKTGELSNTGFLWIIATNTDFMYTNISTVIIMNNIASTNLTDIQEYNNI